MTDLAKRAVACKGWRWMPGMRIESGDSLAPLRIVHEKEPTLAAVSGPWVDPADTGVRWAYGDEPSEFGVIDSGALLLPDLTDPATLGCLLALVREAWGQHYWVRWWRNPAPDMSGKDRAWCEVVDGIGRRLPGPRVQHKTDAEALVDALEAAP